MRGLRIWLWVMTIGGLAVGLLLYLAGVFNESLPLAGDRGLLLASFAAYAVPLLALAVLSAAAMLLTPRSRRLYPAVALLLGVVLLGAAALRYVPLYVADRPAGSEGQRVTVLTANLHFGSSDLGVILNQARMFQADIVVLQEVTPQAWEVAKGSAAGDVLGYYGYQAGEPQPDVFGTMILSRTPLTDVQPIPLSNRGFVATTDLGGPTRVVGVHTTPPLSAGAWRNDFAEITKAATVAGPTILAGDFNASIDHRALRDMLDKTGLVAAADLCGSGWQPTWPAPGAEGPRGRTPFPIVPIDNVFVSSEFACIDTRVLELQSTDHRAVVAMLVRAD